MKTSLRYKFDDYASGYFRGEPEKEFPKHGYLIDPIYYDSGRLAAHDFIEHPRGRPTGSLEDEIAAYGAIIEGRYWAGLINSGFSSAWEMLASEVRELFENHHGDELQARKRYPPYCDEQEHIAKLVARDDKKLARYVEAWFQYGARRMVQRFGDSHEAVGLFMDIEKVYNDTASSKPTDFAIRIDGARVDGVVLRSDYW